MTAEKEKLIIIAFLRESAERIFGKGIYANGGDYDPVAVFWMNEALELAANAIENNEHY